MHSATCDMLSATCDMLSATCDMLSATCNMLSATCDMHHPPRSNTLKPAARARRAARIGRLREPRAVSTVRSPGRTSSSAGATCTRLARRARRASAAARAGGAAAQRNARRPATHYPRRHLCCTIRCNAGMLRRTNSNCLSRIQGMPPPWPCGRPCPCFGGEAIVLMWCESRSYCPSSAAGLQAPTAWPLRHARAQPRDAAV